MTTVSMTQARHEFSDLANRVIFTGETIIIKKNGKVAFAMVPSKDVEILQALEDRFDLEEALEALKEPGSVSLGDFKKQLGL